MSNEMKPEEFNQAAPSITLTPIGQIRTGYHALQDCPMAAQFNEGETRLQLDPALQLGLQNLALSSHVIVLYWFDRANRSQLTRHGDMSETARGVFASRSPNRPNPIALSVVKLLRVEDNEVITSGLDCLHGTILLDIKPYVPQDDRFDDAEILWDYECRRPGAGETGNLGCGCNASSN